MLNADCLQEAYRQSRKSDRDFLHHIWRTVPIPRYDAGDRHHQSLVALCIQAEQNAEQVRDSMAPGAGQIKISDTIRRALRETGIASKIDDQVRTILPEHTTIA